MERTGTGLRLPEMLVIEMGAEPWYFTYHDNRRNNAIQHSRADCSRYVPLVLSSTHHRARPCSEPAIKDTSHVPNFTKIGEERAQVGELSVVGIVKPRRDRDCIIGVEDI